MEIRKQRDYSDYKECKCIICEKEASKKTVSNPKDSVHYHCDNCGDFYVTEQFEDRDKDIHSAIDRTKLAGYIREQNERGNDNIWISTKNIQDILNSSLIPRTVSQKIECFVRFLDRQTTYLSKKVCFFSEETAVCYAENRLELLGIVEACENEGYINKKMKSPHLDSGVLDNRILYSVDLTLKGHQYAEELRKTERNSKSAFVAMWFSDEVREAYEAGIKAAIEAKECGRFKAFRVDNLEHNNDVTDEIIAGIKEAKFVVADLSGNRGGVYYEAGFAKGLGKPVILTCRKDWFDGPDDDHKVHFDVNHLSIIVWETPEELKKKLINRIRATIL